MGDVTAAPQAAGVPKGQGTLDNYAFGPFDTGDG